MPPMSDEAAALKRQAFDAADLLVLEQGIAATGAVRVLLALAWVDGYAAGAKWAGETSVRVVRDYLRTLA